MQNAGKRSRWLFAVTAMSLAAGCQVAPSNITNLTSNNPVVSKAPAAYHVAGISTTRYIVSLTSDAIPANLGSTVQAAGGTLVKTLDGMGVAIATSTQSDFASKLAAASGIESVSLEKYSKRLGAIYGAKFAGSPSSTTPTADSAPLMPYQWGLTDAHVPQAWQRGYTGKGVEVAVLDTGVDDQNPNLAPNIDTALSTSFVDSEPSYVDYNGHGSHVAGIIAAAANGVGVSGVAPDAKFFAVKVLDETGSGTDAELLQGIKYAADHHARIINMSIEELTPDRSLVKAYAHAMRYAQNHGSILVACAGNFMMDPTQNGLYEVPAQVNSAIAVSAVGPQNQQNFDTFALYSNFGNWVDVSAPGGNVLGFDQYGNVQVNPADMILSTWSTQAITYQELGVTFGPSMFMYLAGTSMAAPHVAGELALILQAHPHITPGEARALLELSSDDLGKPGKDPYYGFGRIDAGNATALGGEHGDHDSK